MLFPSPLGGIEGGTASVCFTPSRESGKARRKKMLNAGFWVLNCSRLLHPWKISPPTTKKLSKGLRWLFCFWCASPLVCLVVTNSIPWFVYNGPVLDCLNRWLRWSKDFADFSHVKFREAMDLYRLDICNGPISLAQTAITSALYGKFFGLKVNSLSY